MNSWITKPSKHNTHLRHPNHQGPRLAAASGTHIPTHPLAPLSHPRAHGPITHTSTQWPSSRCFKPKKIIIRLKFRSLLAKGGMWIGFLVSPFFSPPLISKPSWRICLPANWGGERDQVGRCAKLGLTTCQIRRSPDVRKKTKMELVMIRESGNEQLVNRGRKDTGQVRRESIECTVIRRSGCDSARK